MDERETQLFMNLLVYGIGRGISSLMEDGVRFVARQAGFAFLDDKGKVLLKEIGIPDIEDKDIKTIVEKWRDAVKEKKIAQRFDILDLTEDHMKIRVGECVLAHSCRMLREQGVKIPPCPILGFLIAIIRRNTGIETTLVDSKFEPELNSTLFEISLANWQKQS
nr:hypothetical protein [Candidatus Freyrarchaeum guaymaensis]